MIATWWAALSVAMKFIWAITLSASLIFVIEIVMTFLGIGGDTDMDIPDDVSIGDGAGSSLYTFRNLINFIMGFGWSYILLQEQVKSTLLLIFISTLVGVGLVAMVMWLFKWLSSMQQSGNIDLKKEAIGCKGKVYLSIPAEQKGSGKVQISIKDSIREYDAVTEGESLPTGTIIKVSDVLDSNTLMVESAESLII